MKDVLFDDDMRDICTVEFFHNRERDLFLMRWDAFHFCMKYSIEEILDRPKGILLTPQNAPTPKKCKYKMERELLENNLSKL